MNETPRGGKPVGEAARNVIRHEQKQWIFAGLQLNAISTLLVAIIHGLEPGMGIEYADFGTVPEKIATIRGQLDQLQELHSTAVVGKEFMV
jgi:hypothetical protein